MQYGSHSAIASQGAMELLVCNNKQDQQGSWCWEKTSTTTKCRFFCLTNLVQPCEKPESARRTNYGPLFQWFSRSFYTKQLLWGHTSKSKQNWTLNSMATFLVGPAGDVKIPIKRWWCIVQSHTDNKVFVVAWIVAEFPAFLLALDDDGAQKLLVKSNWWCMIVNE